MDNCNFLIFLIVLLINILILNYVIKLEKITCECSDNWKRDYIKYYAIVTLLLTLVICVIPVMNMILNKKMNMKSILSTPVSRVISSIYGVAGIVNVYALFSYSQNVILSQCDCSKSWERMFIYYYSMVIMSLYIFIASMVIIATICTGDVVHLKKTMKTMAYLNNKNNK